MSSVASQTALGGIGNPEFLKQFLTFTASTIKIAMVDCKRACGCTLYPKRIQIPKTWHVMILLRSPFAHFFTHIFLDLLQAIELPCVLLGWLQSSDDFLECFPGIGGFVVVVVFVISGDNPLVNKRRVATAVPSTARRRTVQNKKSLRGSILPNLCEFLTFDWFITGRRFDHTPVWFFLAL